MTIQNEFFKNLYNEHIEYKVVRKQEGPLYEKYISDVTHWKVKYLEYVFYSIFKTENIKSVLEIGCATGVLLDSIFEGINLEKTGIDISDENILFAKSQRPDIKFFSGTFDEYLKLDLNRRSSVIILSDILEHVEDDVDLLKKAGLYSDIVLLNLPLEKVKEYFGRNYGVDDKEGHLRAYSTEDAIELCVNSNMEIMYSTEKKYVLEPVFRKYLLDKILSKNNSKSDSIIEYTKEIIDIELNQNNYKRNFFALLRTKK